jgi:heme/copper-type cytochrome/quinol oxidase subunit 2
MIAGLIVWASAFVMLYAGYSLGCMQLAPAHPIGLINPVTIGLLIIAGIHMTVLAGLILRLWQHPPKPASGETERSCHFRRRIEALVLWTSAAGLIFITFPVLMVAPCVG